MRRIIMFFCLLLPGSIAFSQEALSPGFIITNSGDTLKGLLAYSSLVNNPRVVTLTSPGAALKTIPVSALQKVTIDGQATFVKAVLAISARPLDTLALKNYIDAGTWTDTLLLKSLVAGGTSLYYYHDFKDHFFLQHESGPIEELVYEIEADEFNTRFFENNTFRKQISESLSGTPAESPMAARIPKLQYREPALSEFFKIVDSINSGKIEAKKYEKPIKMKFFVGLGIAYNHMTASGAGNASVSSIEYIGKVRPGIQIGMDFSSTRKMQNLIIRTELGYYRYVQMGDGVVQESPGERPRTTNYQILILSLKPSLNVLYKFIDKPGLGLYLGAGYVGNFTTNSRNRMRVDYLDDGSADLWDPYLQVQTYWGQGVAKAGIFIKNRFEIGLNIPFAGSFLQYDDLKVKPGNYTIQFNIHF